MTTQQIVNDLILDNQNLVIEELMKHDECLWDYLENFDEDTEVLEWWLVTPFMADMLKNNGEVVLAAYDCCNSINGTEHSRDFHFKFGLTGVDLEVSLTINSINT